MFQLEFAGIVALAVILIMLASAAGWRFFGNAQVQLISKKTKNRASKRSPTMRPQSHHNLPAVSTRRTRWNATNLGQVSAGASAAAAAADAAAAASQAAREARRAAAGSAGMAAVVEEDDEDQEVWGMLEESEQMDEPRTHRIQEEAGAGLGAVAKLLGLGENEGFACESRSQCAPGTRAQGDDGQGEEGSRDLFEPSADWFMRARVASTDSMEVHDDGEGEIWTIAAAHAEIDGSQDRIMMQDNGILFGRQMQVLEAHMEADEPEEPCEDTATSPPGTQPSLPNLHLPQPPAVHPPISPRPRCSPPCPHGGLRVHAGGFECKPAESLFGNCSEPESRRRAVASPIPPSSPPPDRPRPQPSTRSRCTSPASSMSASPPSLILSSPGSALVAFAAEPMRGEGRLDGDANDKLQASLAARKDEA